VQQHLGSKLLTDAVPALIGVTWSRINATWQSSRSGRLASAVFGKFRETSCSLVCCCIQKHTSTCQEAVRYSIMHQGLTAALPWGLIAASMACLLTLLALFTRAALASHRRCWRVSHFPAKAKETHPRADEDVPVPHTIVLRTLPRSRRRDAAILAARAFCDSPAYVHILRGDRTFRLEALVWLFERNIALVQDESALDPTRCLFSSSDSITSFFWLRHFATPVSLSSKIRAGLLWFPILFGTAPFRRLLSIGDKLDETTRCVVQKHISSDFLKETLVLERMVVDPSLHGRGLGSACLNSALASNAKAPVVLSTQLQRNVDFYSRIGFHVVLEQRFGAPGDPFGFRSWWMLRPAAGAVAASSAKVKSS
jgi:GNAT superfamily N-acetyltransferase